MIDDVARLAAHSRLREETIARICQELIETADLAGESARALADVAAHCGERALLWATRAPDAAYVAVGRPATPLSSEHDVVLELLARPYGAMNSPSGVLRQALEALALTYASHIRVTDPRLDEPTVVVLRVCHDLVLADVQAVAAIY